MPGTINQLILKNTLIGLAESCHAQSEALSILTSAVAALRDAVYEAESEPDELGKQVEEVDGTLKEGLPRLQKILRELQNLIQ
jgi:hypothetical protein